MLKKWHETIWNTEYLSIKNLLMAGEFGLWRIDYDFSKFVREINIQLKYYARTIDRSRRFGP